MHNPTWFLHSEAPIVWDFSRSTLQSCFIAPCIVYRSLRLTAVPICVQASKLAYCF